MPLSGLTTSITGWYARSKSQTTDKEATAPVRALGKGPQFFPSNCSPTCNPVKDWLNLCVRLNKLKPNPSGNGFLENLSATVSILLMLSVLAVFALIFTTIGASFTDAIFEVGSALTTNGISLGYTTVTMGIGYKWLLVAAMTIGRVEILSILVVLFSPWKKRQPTQTEPSEDEVPTEETADIALANLKPQT